MKLIQMFLIFSTFDEHLAFSRADNKLHDYSLVFENNDPDLSLTLDDILVQCSGTRSLNS